VAICLDEIARCQRLTPRPNFIVLLGDRYGWRPLPSRIEKAEFESVLGKVPESDRALLFWSDGPDPQGWYRLDENAVPAEYVLLPRQVGVGETAAKEADRWRYETEPAISRSSSFATNSVSFDENSARRRSGVSIECYSPRPAAQFRESDGRAC
jgi:hypothetical protein